MLGVTHLIYIFRNFVLRNGSKVMEMCTHNEMSL